MAVTVHEESRALDRRIEEVEQAFHELQRRRDQLSEDAFLEREISLLAEWEDHRNLLENCLLPSGNFRRQPARIASSPSAGSANPDVELGSITEY